MTLAAYCRITLWFAYGSWFVACFTCQHVFAQAENGTKSFDISEGDAINTLREAALQADVEFIFSADPVIGVRTNSIQGYFTPLEAFSLMLSDTSLAVVYHQKTGVYAIKQIAGINGSQSKQKPMEGNKMNNKKNFLIKAVATMLTLGFATGDNNLNAQDSEEDVFDLSPFTIYASDNTG
ncbi:MAG: hypothetical protein ACO3UY_09385, partial [Opitutales bacterium]